MLNITSCDSPTALMSDTQRHLFTLVDIVFLCGIISVFGLVANIINMAVFYKQGLNTTINISFFSLAISDLCCLWFQMLYSVNLSMLFMGLNLPIVYIEFTHLTTGVPRVMFARITCQITAFITAERCLCVVFPLHIKRVITNRITTTVILLIFFITSLSLSPLYFTSYYAWKYYPDVNSTLLGLHFTKANDQAHAFVFCCHGLFIFVGYLSVLTFTVILIYKLRQKKAWRQTAKVDQARVKSMSKRERSTISMVVLIAGTLVVCYTPASALGITAFLQPEFSISGFYHNLYFSLWNIAFLFENINSSVNIFLYLKMSCNYRQTFNEVFCKTL